MENMGASPLPGTRATGRAPKVSNVPVQSNGYGSLVGRGDAARNARGAASARDSAVAASRRHNARMNPGRVTGTAGPGRGVRPFPYGNGAHAGRPAPVGAGGLPGDINLGTASQVNTNPFNTLAPRAGNNAEKATAAIGNNKPIRPFPYGNGAHAGMPAPAGTGGLPKDINLGTRSQVNRNPFNTFGGATHAPPRPAGAGAGAVDDAVRNAPTPTAPAREAAERVGKKGFMRSGKGMLIGAGAAVVAGLAYSGRRGEGSSGGRTSQYRY
jgi:hypothetical protein